MTAMSKVIITADIHNGYPGKLKDCIWSMDIIRQYAHQQGIKDVIIAGDLFHDRVSLNIDVLNEVYDLLLKAKTEDQNWYCLCGNHDMFLKNSWKFNSLHIFEKVINIIEDVRLIEIAGASFYILPFVHYESEYMRILSELDIKRAKDGAKTSVLLTHIGVKGATLNHCFLLKNWSVVEFENCGFTRVFTGHFHCHQELGKVVYPGSPIPFNFDEGTTEHGFLVYDTETDSYKFIGIFEIGKQFSDYKPPDYLTILDEDIPRAINLVAGNHVRVVLSKDYTSNELGDIRIALQQKKLAQSVSWLEPKDKINEELVEQTKLNGGGTPRALFESWHEIDQPKDLSKDLLMTLNDQFVLEAEERIVVEEIEE